MPELHSKRAKVWQEAHDQAPLDPGCIHVDALGHEDEVWGGAVKERMGSLLGRQVIGKVWLFPSLDNII